MPLSKAEYSRRLDAALALAGKKRDDVDRVLARPEWKLGQEAASRAGRAGDKQQPTRTLSKALGYLLGVGEAWFETHDWWTLIDGATTPPLDQEADQKARAEARAGEAKQATG